jgi:hypothetical protein
MDNYLRRIAECEVDTRELKLSLQRDPKITLTDLDGVAETSKAEKPLQYSAVRRASLYDAIREMHGYESAVGEKKRRNDGDGLLRNPREG